MQIVPFGATSLTVDGVEERGAGALGRAGAAVSELAMRPIDLTHCSNSDDHSDGGTQPPYGHTDREGLRSALVSQRTETIVSRRQAVGIRRCHPRRAPGVRPQLSSIARSVRALRTALPSASLLK